MVCARGRYTEGGGRAPRHEERHGVRIRRIASTSFGRRRAIGRLIDYATFHVALAWRLLFVRRASVIVTLTTPPLVGLWGHVFAALKRCQHVAFLMDLHPDAEFAHGMLRPRGLLGRALTAIDSFVVRRAERCVCLGPIQTERVRAKGVRAERIVQIPVWNDGDEIAPREHADNDLRTALGWQEKFVVMYSGNAGIAHRFDEILDAARRLDEESSRILFVFVGGGPRTPDIRANVERSGLGNVRFLPPFERSQLKHSLTAADVHLVTLRDSFAGISVPGKLYGILAAGRPALFVGPQRSDTAMHLAESEAGLAFEPGAGAELAQAILDLASDSNRCRRMGKSGRSYFEARHAAAVCCESWRVLLEELAGGEVPRDRKAATEDVECRRAA